MWKKRAIAATLAALLWPASGSAAPSPSEPAAIRYEAGEPGAHDEQTAVNRELAQFRETRISLHQALVAAERQHPGAKTWDIGFDGTPASPVYRVRTAKLDRVWDYTVDARTGEVAAGEAVAWVKDLDAEDRRKIAALRTIRQGLSDAVLVAERATKGKAVGGTFSEENAKFQFVIVVLSGDDLKQVLLEPPGKHCPSAPAPRVAGARAC